jgi:hypothetical protein
MIREKSHCTFAPLDSRNQESVQIPGFWNPMVTFFDWIPEPGICADSWYLECNGKKVQLDFSLISVCLNLFWEELILGLGRIQEVQEWVERDKEQFFLEKQISLHVPSVS